MLQQGHSGSPMVIKTVNTTLPLNRVCEWRKQPVKCHAMQHLPCSPSIVCGSGQVEVPSTCLPITSFISIMCIEVKERVAMGKCPQSRLAVGEHSREEICYKVVLFIK